jgi:hypothetical protein
MKTDSGTLSTIRIGITPSTNFDNGTTVSDYDDAEDIDHTSVIP